MDETAKELSEALRTELLDPASWHEPLKDFATATNLAVALTDEHGSLLGRCHNPQPVWSAMRGHEAGWSAGCYFCLCPELPCTAAMQACRQRTVKFVQDRAGLVHAAIPLHLNETPLGAVLIGQTFTSFPDQLAIERAARHCGASPTEAWRVARSQRPLPRSSFEVYARLLDTFANSLLRARYAAVLEREGELLRREQLVKDEFLATLGHELRNPLAPILNSLQFVRGIVPADESVAKALSIAERQAHHLNRLVDDLLDVSRITRGTVELRFEEVVLQEIIEGAIDAARPDIERLKGELVVELPSEPVRLRGDPVRLGQVISNLLSNAAKYGEPGGRIGVSMERSDAHVRVTVSDSGRGIDGEFLPRIFDLFARGQSARRSVPSGLGIGLTVARTLVQLHGGTIEAHSDGAGKGSAFTVRLPVQGRTPATTAYDADDRAHEPARALRLLVAEDNLDALDAIATLLEQRGHSVTKASDGRHALALLGAVVPDAVILDLGMPHLDGYELARILRGRREFDPVPLVALTGWGQDRDRQRAIAAGFDLHFSKPLDPVDLEHALARKLREGRAERTTG